MTPRDLDRRAAASAALAAVVLVAHQVAGRATRDALFLSFFPVERLPLAISVSSAVSVVAVLLFARAMARFSPGRVVPAALGLASVLLIVQWLLEPRYPRLCAVTLYLHMAFFGATLVSGFWSLVNERFDPHTAKRAVARIGTGASLGGVVGGALAAGASSLFAANAMLLVMAALNVIALATLLTLRPGVPAAPEAEPQTSSGLAVLRTVPYLRDLALVVALGALAEALLDYVLSAQAVAALGRGGPLLSFFAYFHTGVAVLGFLVQAVLSRRSLERLGLAGSIALQPAGVAATVVLGIVWPGLTTAVLARGVEYVLHGSLFRSGYELLFTPLPHARKRATKAIIDVGFDKVGSVLGGLVTAGLVALGTGGASLTALGVGLATALATLALVPRLHRGYVGALEESLRSGSVRLDSQDVMDGTTRYTLARTGLGLDRDTLMREIEALRGREAGSPATGDGFLAGIAVLRGGDAAAVRSVLAEGVAPAAVAHVIPLLAREELAADVVRALRRVAPAACGALVDGLLDPGNPDAVRRRLPRIIRVCPSPIGVLGLRLGLADAQFDVRYQCAQALASLLARSPELVPTREQVFADVKGELGRMRASGAGERALELVFTLLTLALAREPVQIAYRAVRSQDRGLRGTALEYLENVLPEDVRAALWPFLDAAGPAPHRRAAAEVVAELLSSSERLPAMPRPPREPR